MQKSWIAIRSAISLLLMLPAIAIPLTGTASAQAGDLTPAKTTIAVGDRSITVDGDYIVTKETFDSYTASSSSSPDSLSIIILNAKDTAVHSFSVAAACNTENITISIQNGNWVLGSAIDVMSLEVRQGSLDTASYPVTAKSCFVGAGYDSAVPVTVTLRSSVMNVDWWTVYRGQKSLTFSARQATINTHYFFGGGQSYGKVTFVDGYESYNLEDDNTINRVEFAKIDCDLYVRGDNVLETAPVSTPTLKAAATGLADVATKATIGLPDYRKASITVGGTAKIARAINHALEWVVSSLQPPTALADGVNLYWVGGTGNWNDAANHWSSTSGGSPGASVPTSADDVYFDANSFTGTGQTVTGPAATFYCRNMDWTGALYNPTFSWGAYVFRIYGSATLIPAMTLTSPWGMNFYGTLSHTLTTNGCALTGIDVGIEGTAVLNLVDDISGRTLLLNVGTLNTNGKTITLTSWFKVYSDGGANTFNLGNSSITANQVIFGSGSTINAGTSTITVTGDTFTGASKTFYNVTLSDTTTCTVSGSNTFNTLTIDASAGAKTVQCADGTTQTVNHFARDSSTNVITLTGTSTGGWAITKSDSTPITSLDYLKVSYSTASPAVVWFAGPHSTNDGNNSGWIFNAPDAPTDVSATDGTSPTEVVVTWTKSANALNYVVYRDGTNISGTLGDVATYTDTTAPEGSITPGSVVASDGDYLAFVHLQGVGQAAVNGPNCSYTVVAVNPNGSSSASTADAGCRSGGTLSYQWQRSASYTDGGYLDLTGATTPVYNDYTAIRDGVPRYYRLVLTATGVTGSVASPGDVGFTETVGGDVLSRTLPIVLAAGIIISCVVGIAVTKNLIAGLVIALNGLLVYALILSLLGMI